MRDKIVAVLVLAVFVASIVAVCILIRDYGWYHG